MKIHTLLLIAVIAVTGAFLTACGGAPDVISSARLITRYRQAQRRHRPGCHATPDQAHAGCLAVASSRKSSSSATGQRRPMPVSTRWQARSIARSCQPMATTRQALRGVLLANRAWLRAWSCTRLHRAETAAASTDLSFAQNTGGGIFGLFGPGWVVGVGDTDTYAAAIQAQSVVGGEVVCLQ